MSHAELRTLAQRAVQQRDPELAAKLLDDCRFTLGLNYRQTYQFVQEWTGVDPATWDALLGEPDE